MYRLYYSYKAVGDVLLIVIDETCYPDAIKSRENVTALYKNNKLVGVNIFEISKVVKIHANGLIHYVNEELVKVINSILENASVETLSLEGYSIDIAERG